MRIKTSERLIYVVIVLVICGGMVAFFMLLGEPSMAISPIMDRGYTYENVTADEQVLASAGNLHTVTINKAAGTAGVVTIYDSLTEAGTVIAAITIPNSGMPVTLTYDVAVGTGIYMGFDGTIVAGNLTVSYY